MVIFLLPQFLALFIFSASLRIRKLSLQSFDLTDLECLSTCNLQDFKAIELENYISTVSAEL